MLEIIYLKVKKMKKFLILLATILVDEHFNIKDYLSK